MENLFSANIGNLWLKKERFGGKIFTTFEATANTLHSMVMVVNNFDIIIFVN